MAAITITTQSPASARLTDRTRNFGDVLRSEWTKLRSVRSPRYDGGTIGRKEMRSGSSRIPNSRR